MTMKKQPFEDVSPIQKMSDFPAIVMLVFDGGYLLFNIHFPSSSGRSILKKMFFHYCHVSHQKNPPILSNILIR